MLCRNFSRGEKSRELVLHITQSRMICLQAAITNWFAVRLKEGEKSGSSVGLLNYPTIVADFNTDLIRWFPVVADGPNYMEHSLNPVFRM